MAKVNDLTGKRFGRLVAQSYTLKRRGESNKHRAIWLCRCDCGKYKEVASNHLVRGAISSCGCLRRESISEIRTKHRMTGSRFYRIWKNIITRTSNRDTPNYINYGARGILVCEGWRDFTVFKADMHESYLSHTGLYGEIDTSIERIDNNKGYSIDNCKWATRTEQNFNTRKNKRYLLNGESLTLTEISNKYNIARETVFYRLKMGWPTDKVVLEPSYRNRVM